MEKQYKIEGNKLILESDRVALDWCTWDYDEDFKEVDRVEHKSRRWSKTVEVILKHISSERLFRLTYEHGLTEMQEHDCYENEFYEVVEKEKTIVEKYYEDKKD